MYKVFRWNPYPIQALPAYAKPGDGKWVCAYRGWFREDAEKLQAELEAQGIRSRLSCRGGSESFYQKEDWPEWS